MATRRDFLKIGSIAAFAGTAMPQSVRKAASRRFLNLPASLAQLETSISGRLGVAVLDTRSGKSIGHRANERFAMCSTFKMLVAAAVLQRTDLRQENLNRAIDIPAKPLLSNSPLTEERAGSQMTVRELCHAILTRSDNTAANLLLATIGGPAGIALFARSLGDTVTRLDRTELA